MAGHRPPTLDLRLALADAPSVWRRLRMSAGATLPRAQRVFCVAFGWPGGRPWAFTAGDLHYESAGGREAHATVRLRQLLPDAGAALDFEYGDTHWHVTVGVERVLPPRDHPVPPECIGGAGEPPHVDAGDVWRWHEARPTPDDAGAVHGVAPPDTPVVGLNLDAINAELARLP